MTRTIELEVASALAAERRTVLAHAASLAGVNQELYPIFRMTAPRAFRERSLFEWPVGKPLFRSWMLAGGILPLDFDRIELVTVDPESGFEECSVMLAMKRWRHERRVLDRGPGSSTVVDRLAFVPRLPGTGWLLEASVRQLFRHRHARLQEIFGPAL
ncbi:MAG TPA: hypothetical protein VMG12_44480 [Polyangiaceae bacterium]|nr:hypothetical protein [Polyangiaceae bacterium]